ncbi:MAG: OmpA family protein [Rhodospirillaceae bacterium]|jgi:OmpA-OmpF porin, OOP family|nr:OmpA family protein [Rhodospirillaceae bacterium]MBT3925783.1 OmpA family protein [Rhodospirillaceae bacterium]MBT5039810.1 OmpA family protein [Rhodospirillaceae bacterium]MBT5675710.1 OmpA family protein [Rhodospirillaceae bacterium]MBT5778757.1 OmpA family protein [Rhodospirillaceae bacterium]
MKYRLLSILKYRALNRSLALGAGLLLLGACSGFGLYDARDAQPSGTAFENALYSEYMTQAEDEYAEFDYSRSDIFAERAVASASGNAPLPVMLENWDIPEANVDELDRARDRLTSALDASGRTKVPVSAAHAQAMFDCWVEEQEENIQPEDIAACRAAFFGAIVTVENALRPAPEPMADPVVEEAEPMALPEIEPASTHYVIYFDFNSATVSKDATHTIGDAVAATRQLKVNDMVVSAHTDRAGASSYNQDLAQKRALAVVDMVRRFGGVNLNINIENHGENQLAAKTVDGVKEGRNRRVEIFLK